MTLNFMKKKIKNNDKFIIIRDIYNINKNINIIYYYIFNEIKVNDKKKLKKWIIENFNEFEKECNNFKSTIEIKSWINRIMIIL